MTDDEFRRYVHNPVALCEELTADEIKKEFMAYSEIASIQELVYGAMMIGMNSPSDDMDASYIAGMVNTLIRNSLRKRLLAK